MIEETFNNDIEIPERFKCALSKRIMDEPVIAFDGYIYDKLSIISYFQHYAKSPKTNEACDAIDEMSWMLFDDNKPKQEIILFKQANNL